MSQASHPGPRAIGGVNWVGLWTLYLREVRRFFKVFTQTVAAPVVTTLLFFAIFALALGRAVTHVGDIPFSQFLAPGLIVMAMVQNSFANTSSSIVIAKVQGNIVDTLMPPLSAGELTLAYALGGASRGLVVGLVVAAAIYLFVPFSLAHPFYVLFHGLAASLMLSLLGVIAGIWSEKFDHMAAVTNFIITPLAFLSGTFYSIERLPPFWHLVAQFNPFFYMIDGFRYGCTGYADGHTGVGILVMIGANLGLALLAWRMFKTGYKLKS